MMHTLMEWLNLFLRWTHLLTGIAWIGSSFYFMWLDSALTPPETKKSDVEGELWMVHSGGFYVVERKKIGPGTMPKVLHWFKYEALFTWITGFLLLSLVYYLTNGAYLLDPNVARIGAGQGTLLGIGTLVISWFIYDFIWQSKFAAKNEAIATFVSLILASAAGYLFCSNLSGRAAYIHLGAMFGTIMVANVWVRILPSQQKMIDATKEGRAPDFSLSAKAKRRSVHNSYMTFPVLFMMISNHYGNIYGNKHNFLALFLLVVLGVAIRHVMIAKNSSGKWAVLPALVSLGVLVYLTLPVSSNASNANHGSLIHGNPSFAQVRIILENRCLECHSQTPRNTQFGPAVPGGMYFDSPNQIRMFADRIKVRAVTTKTMPVQNMTGMTDEERNILGAWIDSGAKTE